MVLCPARGHGEIPAGVGMKGNRRRASLVPITWQVVPWGSRSRLLSTLGPIKAWCRENVGVERADWEFQQQWCRWRFRDADHALLFRLTWC